MISEIRWKQRFQNFEKAFLFLQRSSKLNQFDELQAAGLVQSFEFTFELAWKTLKDYLYFNGIDCKSPRESIKEAFSSELIKDGHLWIEMLDKLGEFSHTYCGAQVQEAIALICNTYLPVIEQAYYTLKYKT